MDLNRAREMPDFRRKFEMNCLCVSLYQRQSCRTFSEALFWQTGVRFLTDRFPTFRAFEADEDPGIRPFFLTGSDEFRFPQSPQLSSQ
jgi:hypothetical protein